MKTTANIIAGKMAANEAEANRIDIRELQTRRLEIVELRDRLVADPSKISDEEITRVVALQNEDGGFALVDDYRMDSDCRVRYVYEPSYACCQILIAAVMHGGGSKEAKQALSRGLSFCYGRRIRLCSRFEKLTLPSFFGSAKQRLRPPEKAPLVPLFARFCPLSGFRV